jgi:hypothetical protein
MNTNNTSRVINLIYIYKHSKNSVSGVYFPSGMAIIFVSVENFGGASNAYFKQICLECHFGQPSHDFAFPDIRYKLRGCLKCVIEQYSKLLILPTWWNDTDNGKESIRRHTSHHYFVHHKSQTNISVIEPRIYAMRS